jgi:hypothetical protein
MATVCNKHQFRDEILIKMQPIVWYDPDGNAMSLPPALDEFVHGENAYSCSHLELQPTTWEACTAYFDATLAQANGIQLIEEGNQYWCWILPMKVEGGKANLVATTSMQKMHVPFPIEKGTRPGLLFEQFDRPRRQARDRRSRPMVPRRHSSAPTARWSIPRSLARTFLWTRASPSSKALRRRW